MLSVSNSVILCMKLPSFADPESLSYIYALLHFSFHQMNAPTRKRRRKIELNGERPETLPLLPEEKRDGDGDGEDDDDDKVSSTDEEKTKSTAKFNLADCRDDGAEGSSERVIKRKKSRAAGGGDSSEVKSDAGGGPHQRRLWVKDRSGAWWDQCNNPNFPEREFKKAFRMGRATFDTICEELSSVIAKEDTTLRTAIPVRQRVAVCLWRLATGDPLRLVSKKFGLGISTCHKLVLEVCTAIKSVLMQKYLQWPDEDTMREIKSEFESISGIPNVVGSMLTSHIPIIAPKADVTAYFNKKHTERNQKTSYSVKVQGVVDPRGVFTDVSIGWPGSMADDEVLEKSALCERANNGGLLNDAWLVGSSGHPLMDWVLVPYTQKNLTWTQHAFNEKIEEVQKIAKDAFARLKGRWSCLQKRTEVKLQDLPLVLGACCVLHNICELNNEQMDPELKIDLVDDEIVPDVALRSARTMKARDAIAHNLLHHGLAGTSFL